MMTEYKAWWHPVVFGPDALPPYLYNVSATVSSWQQLHVDGDLSDRNEGTTFMSLATCSCAGSVLV